MAKIFWVLTFTLKYFTFNLMNTQIDKLDFSKIFYLLGKAHTRAKYVKRDEETSAMIQEIEDELEKALGYNEEL